MSSTSRRRVTALLGVAALALTAVAAVSAPTVSAQSGPEVIATGLDNPRGLAFRPGGDLYVAEAGAGGAGPCFVGPEGPSCFGLSGAVTRINEHGQTQVLTGLPSVGVEGSGDVAIGPSDIGFEGSGSSFVTIGLGADPAIRTQIPALEDMGQILRTRIFKNEWKLLADLGDFEAANDPNADGPDTNPNSVLALSDRRIVADAGANALLRVKDGGKVSVIATFPNVDVPLGGGTFSMDAVPTSVAKGPDGAFYVGQLTGFPFPVGGASVFRVEPGEDPEIVAEGFTNIIDIAFDQDGTLYVLEIFHNALTSGDPTGALIRVEDNGDQEIVMSDGLITPGGLAIRGDYAYVSNCGTCAGAGEVLRIPIDD
jgi:hypothetical protein